VIETHEHKGDFVQMWGAKAMIDSAAAARSRSIWNCAKIVLFEGYSAVVILIINLIQGKRGLVTNTLPLLQGR
jgi:hypothetical protein